MYLRSACVFFITNIKVAISYKPLQYLTVVVPMLPRSAGVPVPHGPAVQLSTQQVLSAISLHPGRATRHALTAKGAR